MYNVWQAVYNTVHARKWTVIPYLPYSALYIYCAPFYLRLRILGVIFIHYIEHSKTQLLFHKIFSWIYRAFQKKSYKHTTRTWINQKTTTKWMTLWCARARHSQASSDWLFLGYFFKNVRSLCYKIDQPKLPICIIKYFSTASAFSYVETLLLMLQLIYWVSLCTEQTASPLSVRKVKLGEYISMNLLL